MSPLLGWIVWIVAAAAGAAMLSALACSALMLRRGSCHACGYSRAGLDRNVACPECGLPPHIAWRRRVRTSALWLGPVVLLAACVPLVDLVTVRLLPLRHSPVTALLMARGVLAYDIEIEAELDRRAVPSVEGITWCNADALWGWQWAIARMTAPELEENAWGEDFDLLACAMGRRSGSTLDAGHPLLTRDQLSYADLLAAQAHLGIPEFVRYWWSEQKHPAEVTLQITRARLTHPTFAKEAFVVLSMSPSNDSMTEVWILRDRGAAMPLELMQACWISHGTGGYLNIRNWVRVDARGNAVVSVEKHWEGRGAHGRTDVYLRLPMRSEADVWYLPTYARHWSHDAGENVLEATWTLAKGDRDELAFTGVLEYSLGLAPFDELLGPDAPPYGPKGDTPKVDMTLNASVTVASGRPLRMQATLDRVTLNLAAKRDFTVSVPMAMDELWPPRFVRKR